MPSVGGDLCLRRWRKLSTPATVSKLAAISSTHARVVSTEPFILNSHRSQATNPSAPNERAHFVKGFIQAINVPIRPVSRNSTYLNHHSSNSSYTSSFNCLLPPTTTSKSA